ncbi:hypothetical protein KC721_03610 [Candidatus Woesebacteria bacterium]|nr:hypothetical protein [Candidatus Woesebacteria bacterium]MCB9802031.1 hypothetical protein [Pseudomonadales bacterium]
MLVVVIGFLISRLVKRSIEHLLRNADALSPDIARIIALVLSMVVVVIAVGYSLNIIGVNIEWVGVSFTLIGLLLFLTLRPLIENMSAGLLLRGRGPLYWK